MRQALRVRWPVVAMLLACAGPKPLPDPFADRPIRTASSEELARHVDADALALAGLRGKLTLAFRASATAAARTCRGALVARSPWTGAPSPGLYLKGYRELLPTLFVLVSDGRSFWLHVPRENVVYTGPVARRHGGGPVGEDFRLDPRDLFRALFVQPLGDPQGLEVAEEPAAYVVTVRRAGRLERRLWVERRRFAVQREVFYDGDGREDLAIERDRYVEIDGRPRPERMRLRDLVTGATVVLEFDRLTLNPADLNVEVFHPSTPPGARTEPVAALEDRS